MPACDPDVLGDCEGGYFLCNEVEDDLTLCEWSEPLTPDDGDWSCEVDGTAVSCDGESLPTGQTGDPETWWHCTEIESGGVTCEREPPFPHDDLADEWDCSYDEDNFWACTSVDEGA
jgi:hypothetical protein